MLNSRVLPSFLLRENPSSLELWTILKEWKWSVRKFYCRNEVLGKLTVPNFTQLCLTIYSNIYLLITCLEPESTGIECARNWMPWYRVVTVQWLDIFLQPNLSPVPKKTVPSRTSGSVTNITNVQMEFQLKNFARTDSFSILSAARGSHAITTSTSTAETVLNSVSRFATNVFENKIVKIKLIFFPELIQVLIQLVKLKDKIWELLFNLIRRCFPNSKR